MASRARRRSKQGHSTRRVKRQRSSRSTRKRRTRARRTPKAKAHLVGRALRQNV